MNKKSRVIFYHDLHSSIQYTEMSTSVEMFEKHIEIIRKKGFEIVDSISKENEQIEISFDDAWAGIYDNIEIIKRLEIPIRIFVITSLMGSENYLSKKKIIELNKNPLVNFQSHTHTHPDLPMLSDKDLEFELSESKNILEGICNKDIDEVCYPMGLFCKRTIEAAKKAGYKVQYSSIPGVFHVREYPAVINRSLVQFAKEEEFRAILKGGDYILSLWYKIKHFIK